MEPLSVSVARCSPTLFLKLTHTHARSQAHAQFNLRSKLVLREEIGPLELCVGIYQLLMLSARQAGWACASFFFVSWFVSTFGADGWSVGTLSKAQLKKANQSLYLLNFCFQLIINNRKIRNKCKWMHRKWNKYAKWHEKCAKLQWKVQTKIYWFSSTNEANNDDEEEEAAATAQKYKLCAVRFPTDCERPCVYKYMFAVCACVWIALVCVAKFQCSDLCCCYVLA